MTNEFKLIQEIEAGELSRSVLEQIESRLDLMAENVHEKWETTGWDDAEGREACWRQLKAIRELKRSFEVDIQTAKLAQYELENTHG